MKAVAPGRTRANSAPVRLNQPTGRVVPFGRRVGSWRIVGPRALGASAEVLDVVHPGTRDPGVLKRLLPAARRDPRARQRFEAEIAVNRRLDHPRCAALLDDGEDADGRWMVSERLPGPTLAALIAQPGDAEPRAHRRRLLSVWRDVAAGVEAAHHVGVLHRDLKPANVVLDADGRGCVVDWGLALLRGAPSEAEPAGLPFGTPGYLSPEQARGEVQKWDPRMDVWGLGGLLYAVLTGRRPYEGHDTLAVLTAMGSAPRRADRCGASLPVPAALADACALGLAIDPADRPTDICQLDARVAAWLRWG